MDPSRSQESHGLLLMSLDDNPAPSKTGLRNRLQLRLFKLVGWKSTLLFVSINCLVVFSVNIGSFSWALARGNVENGRGVLYEGNCDYVRHLNTGVHVLINILSTGLLAASNYGTQCLCAPTRKDVDKAHRRGNWLDIGVPSLRNLLYVSKWRLLMWIFLALSSIPLHLVYNSTIFFTFSAYQYSVFAGRGSLEKMSLEMILQNSPFGGDEIGLMSGIHQGATNGTLTKLDSSACIDAYATTWQTMYSNLLLVTDDVNRENEFEYAFITRQDVFSPRPPEPIDPFSWICDMYSPGRREPFCSSYLSQIDRSKWTIDGYHLASCLAENLPGHCKLEYSLSLLITVMIVNIIKAVILCYMSVRKDEAPLMTTGDAVASILQEPDNCSIGRCLATQNELKKLQYREAAAPLPFENRKRRWFISVSQEKWALAFMLWLLAITICIFLLISGHVSDGSQIWNTEFGSVNPQAIIKGDSWPTTLIKNTIIANLPQLIFSLIYFVSNGVSTKMTLAAEWSRYAISHRGIRVSWNPQSAQRSTYFLSLPYRYAIPLMTVHTLLHWLISQSIFLVAVEAYKKLQGRTPEIDYMACGYNPIAIVISLAVGSLRFACLLGLGLFRRLSSGIVLAGSCSLAIAASCHPRYDPNLPVVDREGATTPDGNIEESAQSDADEHMQFRPIKWGAVPVSGDLGHCSLSSVEVELPEEGRLYQ